MFCKHCFSWSAFSVGFAEEIRICWESGACVCEHITDASHSGTEMIGEVRSKPGHVASLKLILISVLSEVWMSRGNLFRTTESQCLSASSVFRKPHPSLRFFWTPVFVLVCVFHCVTFVWCMYVFLFPKHAYVVVQVLGPRVMAFVT